MYSRMRSLSAPELYVRSTETLTKTTNLTTNDGNYSYSSGVGPSTDSRQQVKTQPVASHDRAKRKFILHRPGRIAFLSYVYVLLGSQVFLSALQWLCSTYRWRPQLNGAERSLYMLLLLLTWLNLSLAFFAFRRLQISSPFNWIVFLCMFESLTLIVLCLCVRELDLAWYFILIAISIILLYTPLGLWIPPKLTANVWILILMAMSVLITSMVCLASGVCMRFYMLATACLVFFGPWTTYNVFKLHTTALDKSNRFKYLEHAAKMFITYGCTVGGLVVVNRVAIGTIESENCKSRIFSNQISLGVT